MSELISSVQEFIDWTGRLQGQFLLYRGLPDASWDVESSAYRRIRGENDIQQVPPKSFQNYIEQLLDRAKLQGFRVRYGKELHDLELLAELQHHGAATCLIDFTTNALTALWFACEDKADKPGKVVAMMTEDSEKFSEIDFKSLEKPIKDFLDQGKFWKWVPASLENSRVVAQQSVFVFGEGKVEEKYYKKVDIDKDSKQEIKTELEKKFGIKEQHFFSDFTGFALSNAHNKPYNYTVEDYFLLGLIFHQQAAYKKAIVNYSESISLDPYNTASYNNRGNSKSSLGNHQEAIKDYDKAIELDPQNATAHCNRGIAKADLGNNQEAIKDYDKAIELNPQFAKAYNNRGNAKNNLGNHEEAIKDLDKAIELDPHIAEAYNNRGNAKADLGNNQEAIKDYDKAIELNPQFAKAYNNRGTAKADLGNNQEAIKDYDKAIELNPQYANAYRNRGISQRALGNEEGAEEDLAKAEELDSNTIIPAN